MRCLALALLFCAIPSLEVLAQGIIIPRPRPCVPPRECVPVDAEIVRTRSDVRVELVGRVLQFEVEERFRNRGGRVGEADYMFPLPKGAAFQDLKLSIDGQMVAGETMDAAEARRIYEEIVRQQRDPALVEWMGHGLLRTRIFPIQPGEERRVVVRFQMVAEREGDLLRVDYFRGSRTPGQPQPMPIVRPLGEPGARGTARGEHAEGRTTFVLTYPNTPELGRAYSPTHAVDISVRNGRRVATVEGDGAGVTVLIPSRRGSAAAIGAIAHAPGRDDGFVLLTVSPPAIASAVSMPRDVAFVVDVSGSMSGGKIEQARAAGLALLATLRPIDRFRIIDFASDVRSFRDDAVPATRENLAAARRYIERLEANGGTNISGALDEALRADSWNEGRSRGERASGERSVGERSSPERASDAAVRGERLGFALFVTDGAPTVGERNPSAIADRVRRIRGDRRLFTFGVGADVNTQLVEQLAIEGRGSAHFVRPDESVEHAVGIVASRLRDPVLSDARIIVEGAGVRLNRILPGGGLDIFAGQDLVVLARYSGSGRARVTVTGRSARTGGSGDRHLRWSTDITLPDRERDNGFVARLWATQRVGWLAAEKRKARGHTREIDDEIRQLGERYGIPTEFTSYFVTEPGMVVASPTQVHRRDGRGAAAPPPVSTEAAVAFESGRRAAQQRAATSLATVGEADGSAAADAAAALRRVGTRAFAMKEGRWTDVAHTPAARIVRVKAYSGAYFRILDALPELRQYVAVAENVLIAGRGVALEIAPSGLERIGDEELRMLRRALSDQEP
jgi:Ca-activated chloride channel homolog